MSEASNGILQGLKEALAHVKGEADLSLYRVHQPKILDVRAIRAKTGMTQEAFARAAVSASTRSATGNKASATPKARHGHTSR